MEFYPPEELIGRFVTLRRYRLNDLPALKKAIEDSLDSLMGWMPWAKGSPTDESVLAFLQPAAEKFGGHSEANFAITLSATGEFVGGCSLMPRVGPEALEIGYWVHTRHQRQGIASEAAGLLANIALTLPGIRRVEIHCDEANLASRGVPSALGFRLDRIEPDEIDAPSEIGRSMIWTTEAPVSMPDRPN
jgi:RimJ/RimL family protein N-acetyltransferase